MSHTSSAKWAGAKTIHEMTAKLAMPRRLKDALLAPKISLIGLFGAVCLFLVCRAVIGTFSHAIRHTEGSWQAVAAQSVHSRSDRCPYYSISDPSSPPYHGVLVQGWTPGQALRSSSGSSALLWRQTIRLWWTTGSGPTEAGALTRPRS